MLCISLDLLCKYIVSVGLLGVCICVHVSMCAYASAVVAIEVEFSNQDSALNPNIKKQQMLVDALSTYSCVSAYSHSFSR